MIAELVDSKVGADPGFMDKSIPSGGRWTGELLGAVGTCQVFVALLSAPYFTSEWCGMEWYAFEQRAVKHRGGGPGHQTAIIPVIWAPWHAEIRVPGVVGALQRFSPDGLPDSGIADLYRQQGVLGLSKVAKDACESVVWLLARRVVSVAYDLQVEPRVLERADLRNIFEGPP